uniref:Putative ovule protein n=1 Tax=Solanum chacoense TaxID=4108 RepID=A0A0V0I502_SOLCH
MAIRTSEHSDTIMFLSNERDSYLGKPHKRLQLVFRAIYFVAFLNKKRIDRNTLVLSQLVRDPSVNVAALVINFVAAASSGEVPLTAVQLLWVNLIMDTLGALALATERPSSDLMNKKPVGRTKPLITGVMWRNLLAQALYQVTVLLITE